MSVNRRLYVSHFLSTWNSRAFEFGAVLFIASIFPGSLLPTSVYALARALSAILFSPSVGKYIDQNDRLHVVRLSILAQRMVVAASCAIFYLLLINPAWKPAIKWTCLGATAFLACIEKLCSIMNLISVERDWVVVVAGEDEDSLRKLNSQMRRIDLVCKLAGPLAISVIAGFSINIAILVTLGWNIVSVIVEYGAIAKVYILIPALQVKNAPSTISEGEARAEEAPLLGSERLEPTSSSHLDSLQTYFQSPMVLPSLALSFLYLTVLNFSGQMVTYLLALPPLPNTSFFFDATTIGLLRTLSIISEISATFLSPFLMSRIGPIRSGLWAINEQMGSLLIGMSFFIHYSNSNSPSIASIPLVVSVILSRMGLWSFDLSVQLQIQQGVPKSQMGKFSTVETSLQNFFELLSYASTIVFSRPDQFRWPVLMSCGGVFVGGMLYARFVRLRRGHLLHLGPCLEVKMDVLSDQASERSLRFSRD